MKSNFEFLIGEWKDIFERAKHSEENAYPDTRASYVFARMCLELTLKLAYEIDPDLEKKKYDSLDNLIDNYVFKQKVKNIHLLDKILKIKTEGNKAVHYDKLKHNDPKIIIKYLFEFTKWFAKTYGENEFDFNKNFDESILKLHKDKIALTKEELLKLEENLKKENQSIIEDFQKKILELEEKMVFQLRKNAELESEVLDLRRIISENQRIIDSFNELKKSNPTNETFFSFDISEVGLTIQKGLIWGRVFINFSYDNQNYFAVKYFSPNELGKVQERHLISKGIFQDSELYKLFDTKYDNLSYEDVQSGKFDDLELVLNFDKRRFGTPSLLIEKLILDLKKQFAFKKGDKEWRENGFYIIDNKEYMSIWTFKKYYNLNSENTTSQNGSDAIALLTRNTPFYTSKPDFGSFREIKIYPVENLKEFYSINKKMETKITDIHNEKGVEYYFNEQKYKKQMKARFFYAKQSFNTWPKLFVLTEDGRFYCEYLNYKRPARVDLKFDFNTFKAEDYKWDGYQSIVEIDEQKAKNTLLKMQPNWIERYLNSL